MGQRRHHYEQAFEHFLRERQIPFVSVNEARRALFGAQYESTPMTRTPGYDHDKATSDHPARPLKSFDHVLYGEGLNLIVDVKGRKIASRKPRTKQSSDTRRKPQNDSDRPTRGRLESWVTQDDVDSLSTWQSLFGDGFSAAFVFVYWCDEQPPSALFEEIFSYQGKWYAVRAVELGTYRSQMKVRSPRWRTVHVPTAAFEKISGPLVDQSEYKAS
ncbi:MAG: HYExAFE family protein [Phycisphaeraceae bacterium]|nr:HYExAFE family protein [Phycisphaerales bacterium]MCB9859275.1 HYExAFE family protein [Phycisphaeraceae bacterium]